MVWDDPPFSITQVMYSPNREHVELWSGQNLSFRNQKFNKNLLKPQKREQNDFSSKYLNQTQVSSAALGCCCLRVRRRLKSQVRTRRRSKPRQERFTLIHFYQVGGRRRISWCCKALCEVDPAGKLIDTWRNVLQELWLRNKELTQPVLQTQTLRTTEWIRQAFSHFKVWMRNCCALCFRWEIKKNKTNGHVDCVSDIWINIHFI